MEYNCSTCLRYHEVEDGCHKTCYDYSGWMPKEPQKETRNDCNGCAQKVITEDGMIGCKCPRPHHCNECTTEDQERFYKGENVKMEHLCDSCRYCDSGSVKCKTCGEDYSNYKTPEVFKATESMDDTAKTDGDKGIKTAQFRAADGRLCSTCRHEGCDANCYPCLGCINSNRVRWEAKQSKQLRDAPMGSKETTQDWITLVCDEIKELLLSKNRKYGDSALNPCRVFAKSDTLEQLNVRIDDKLNRIRNRQNDEDEDVELDLIGYLILKRIAKLTKKD